MTESANRKPDIESLIQQVEERQRLVTNDGKKNEFSLPEIMVLMSYGSYRLGLEVAGGLRLPVEDIGRVTIDELLPRA